MNFNEAWDYILKRSEKWRIPIVQDRTELEYVFNLMKDCKSYLEVGTAEGNSLFVLANAMPKGSEITYVDWAENHTKEPRDEVLAALKDYKITPVHGDSNDKTTHDKVLYDEDCFVLPKTYDVVLIDAGHDDFNVAIDAMYYGCVANKYVIFHDIQLPDVNRAFEWYCRQYHKRKNYRVVNSESFGYGIIEVQ